MPFLFEMAVTQQQREIMLEAQGANILIEILNKFEIWERNLDLAVNIFPLIGQESAGCWHLLLCRKPNTELLPLLEQPT